MPFLYWRGWARHCPYQVLPAMACTMSMILPYHDAPGPREFSLMGLGAIPLSLLQNINHGENGEALSHLGIGRWGRSHRKLGAKQKG